MGKYIKKSRPADVAVMDGPLGVRTRAKTLALLQQQSSRLSALRKTSSAAAATQALMESSGYLELRNRKLARMFVRAQAAGGVGNSGFEVPPSLEEETTGNHPGTHDSLAAAAPAAADRKDINAAVSSRQEPAARLPCALRASHSDSCLNQRLSVSLSRPAQSASNSASVASIRSTDPATESAHTGQSMNVEVAEAAAAAAAACCGDNAGVFCEKESSSSQGATTSCTFEDVSVRPGATGSSSTQQQQHEQRPVMRPTTTGCGPAWRHRTPASDEIDDFFAEVEEQNEQDRRRFLAKYNFDVVEDVPLPGRFEWVQLHSAT